MARPLCVMDSGCGVSHNSAFEKGERGQMRKIIIVAMAVMMMFATSCASLKRAGKDIKSDFGSGLNRIVTVYTADGEVLKTYEGKIDLAPTEGGIVKFDLNGQRIIYYNCYVEVLEKVE